VSGPPRRRIGATVHRLIASRYPTIGVFDAIATTRQELRDAFLLESLTNDRLTLPAKRLALLPDSEIVGGPTASLVMAAFLHADPAGGRFTDARLGAWYACLDRPTAIAETVYHHERRLRLSAGGFPQTIQMRQLCADIDTPLADVRGWGNRRPEIYHPLDYTASRAFAAGLRWPEPPAVAANGICYDSVRRAGGINVCVFWPSLIPLPLRQGDHFEYRWDAAGRASVFALSAADPGIDPA
jgi:hypothetical protein